MNPSASGSQKAESVINSLVLNSELAELVKLSTWIEGLADELNLSGDDAFKLELILTEAVTNVIQHGYRETSNGDIEVSVQERANQLFIKVKDTAKAFNPLQQPEVKFPRTLDEASEGGLGIHLIRNYTDECSYQRSGEHNVLIMVLTVTKREPDKPTV